MAFDFASLFQGNTSAVGPQQPGPLNIGSILGGAKEAVGSVSNFIQNNPDQFAFIADTIGKTLDPNNPFAGAGTTIAQSRIASKAAKEQKEQSDDIISLLSGILSDDSNDFESAAISGEGENRKLKFGLRAPQNVGNLLQGTTTAPQIPGGTGSLERAWQGLVEVSNG